MKKAELGLAKFLPRDQVNMVMENKDFRKSNRRWSEEAIRDGLLKKSCWGKKGYEISIESNMPYPSNKTLLERIKHVKFEPGIQTVLIEGLRKKLEKMKDRDLASYAILSFDEITHRYIWRLKI